jgi:radical SAM protein with 4Fe4S-binding SPASM domain
MNKIIDIHPINNKTASKVISITPQTTNIVGTHLVDDGDNTRTVSSIVSGTHLPIDDAPYTLFRLKQTNTSIVYNNFTNGIYDNNLNSLSEVTNPSEKWYNSLTHVKKKTKSNKPVWLRILFGHACNYSCSYCLQKDIGNPDERGKIWSLDYFIDTVKNKLDLSELQKIDLWGGETMLYWKSITPIIEEFDRAGLEWYFPTNGTPLRQKHIEYLSNIKGMALFGISHDGPEHEALRGKEFLWDKHTIEVLKKMQQNRNKIRFSFNPVISATNYDLFKINNFFKDYMLEVGLDPELTSISYTLGRVHTDEDHEGSVSMDHVIQGEDLIKFRDIMNRFIECNIEQAQGIKEHGLIRSNIFHNGPRSVLGFGETLEKQILPTISTVCGADDDQVLSVDVAGNVRTCPHVDDSFISGKIEELEKVELKKVDLSRYDKHCKVCPVYRLCKSNCPINVPDYVFLTNCALEKVYNKAIQRGALNALFGADVELIESGLNEDTIRKYKT